MLTITYECTDPYAVRGMPFHTRPAERLVFVSPELVALGCPKNDVAQAITWAACNNSLRLVSRKPTKLISRTMREMTLTLEVL